jgi:hypothetical protein
MSGRGLEQFSPAHAARASARGSDALTRAAPAGVLLARFASCQGSVARSNTSEALEHQKWNAVCAAASEPASGRRRLTHVIESARFSAKLKLRQADGSMGVGARAATNDSPSSGGPIGAAPARSTIVAVRSSCVDGSAMVVLAGMRGPLM